MSNLRRIAVALRVDEPFPHHHDVLSGVLEYARDRPDWHCIVDEHPTYSTARRGQQPRAYDGVIARASPELQRRLAKLGIPLVNIWNQHARPGVAGVYSDTKTIGRVMADHLIDRGYRTLAFVAPREYKQDQEIGKAFAQAAAERGCPCTIEDCPSDTDFGDRGEWLALRRHVDSLLDKLPRPVGIFVTLPTVARVVTTTVQERERRGMRNVGVVCYLNVKTIVEAPPQITSIDGNHVRVGYAAAELLDHLMTGAAVPGTVRRIPPKGVIVRESTDGFAVEDELVAAALRYISGHLRKPLSLDEIASAIATSPRSLQRRFEAALSCPVSNEIRRLRIELAKRLLGDGKLSMDQIAREAGFSSAEVMNHVFHREVGMSPSAYRKQVHGESSRG